MLDTRQSAILCGGGTLFWLGDVAWIRLVPAFVVDPFWGDVGFLLSVPLAVLCVRVCQRLAGLGGAQLVPGATLLVVVAALFHALALRWAPALYGGDHAGRLGGAWLLWIYGLILGSALLAARMRPNQPRPNPSLGQEAKARALPTHLLRSSVRWGRHAKRAYAKRLQNP